MKRSCFLIPICVHLRNLRMLFFSRLNFRRALRWMPPVREVWSNMSKLFLLTGLLFFVAAQAIAERYSTEDETRFGSQPYEKAEPGMAAPAVYLAQAKAALHKRYAEFRTDAYEAPTVTHRFYRDAPAADRDIICVQFAFKELTKTPVAAMKRLPNPEWMVRPALLILMRKDRSKIYVNEVYYQVW